MSSLRASSVQQVASTRSARQTCAPVHAKVSSRKVCTPCASATLRAPAQSRVAGRRQHVAPRIGRTALKVVAFRDEARQKQLLDVGSSFVNKWFKGITSGVDQQLQKELDESMSDDIKFTAQLVTEAHQAKDVAGVLQHLRTENQKLHIRGHKVLIQAANVDMDSYFALLEVTYDGPKGSGDCLSYQVIKLSIEIDDSVRRVVEIIQRGQLTLGTIEKVQKSKNADELCHPTPFPAGDLSDKPSGWDSSSSALLEVSKTWAKARSSGQSESLLDEILDPSFRLWDAYGLLPVLADPSKEASKDATVVPFQHIKEIVKKSKSMYDIESYRVDVAIADDTTAGFSQWRSHLKNKETQAQFDCDAIQVDIFTPEGKLRDAWLFRDPLDFEKSQLGL